MFSKKLIYIIFLILLISKGAVAQNDHYGRPNDIEDEEIITLGEVGFSILIGLILVFVGYFLKSIKMTEGLGKIVNVFGYIIAIGSLVMYVLQIATLVLTTVISIGIKIALVIGGVYLAYCILKYLFNSIKNGP